MAGAAARADRLWGFSVCGIFELCRKSAETLFEQGYLTADDIKLPDYLSAEGAVDFGSVVYWKTPLLKKAASKFLDKIKEDNASSAELAEAFRHFKKKKYLGDYALFMSIKETYKSSSGRAVR